MGISENPQPEHPSTYFVTDRSSQDEMNRLLVQDQMLTANMGGVLAEQTDPASFRRVLDVGCGSGGWLLNVATAYPSISLLIGVDVSRKMVDFARGQSAAQQLSERLEYHTMDALRMLEFPNAFFSLVNQRTAAGYLRTWDWPKLLQEYWRVLHSNGIVRITEGDWLGTSNSPALTRLLEIVLAAFYQAGHSFTSTGDGVTAHLAGLLKQAGFENIQTHVHVQEYRAGTENRRLFIEDMRLTFRTVVPFLEKWTRLPADYDAIYQQALEEMQRPDFIVTGNLLTIWGVKSPVPV
ncbi:MAG TPA: methyltransferase domain-containing protein [Ktedonobacteraceae bacterium]